MRWAYIYRLLSISKHCLSFCKISLYLSSTAVYCYCCGKRMLHANSRDRESLNIFLFPHCLSTKELFFRGTQPKYVVHIGGAIEHTWDNAVPFPCLCCWLCFMGSALRIEWCLRMSCFGSWRRSSWGDGRLTRCRLGRCPARTRWVWALAWPGPWSGWTWCRELCPVSAAESIKIL